jgi:hypothetical protein
MTNNYELASGVMLLMNKEDAVAMLQNIVSIEGMLGVDNEIHRQFAKMKRKVGLLKGIYLYHYYSNWNGFSPRDVSHLK